MQVVTSQQMKEMEAASLSYDLTYARLMENAGAAAAAFIRRTIQVQGRNCIIFCGDGNNGGDGLVVARKLSENGANVVVVLTGGPPRSKEAANMLTMVEIMDLPVLTMEKGQSKILEFLPHTDIVVDAIYGAGFRGDLEGMPALACTMINEAIAAVVSLDLPSGAECDTGRLAHGCVQADFTVTFDSMKPVHVHDTGASACGQVEVVDIGIPPEVRASVLARTAEALPAGVEASPEAANLDAAGGTAGREEDAESDASITLAQVMEQLPPRPQDAHKGTFGTLLNICGSALYRGAAVLSTMGALRSGVGVCCLASVEPACAAAAFRTCEATFLPLAANAQGGISAGAAPLLVDRARHVSAVLFGCGMGNTADTLSLLDVLLEQTECPLILDADGINALDGNIMKVKNRRFPVILTPHPGEMARLTGLGVEEIQADRQGVASRFAQVMGAVVVLKGHETVIASPRGQVLFNRTGNSGLSRGGSGDLLAGIIGSFAAQGLDPVWAAACGVHLHGLAADRTAGRLSTTAMLPSDLLEDLGQIFLEQGR